jgi:hypothetical protein
LFVAFRFPLSPNASVAMTTTSERAPTQTRQEKDKEEKKSKFFVTFFFSLFLSLVDSHGKFSIVRSL